MAEPIRRTQAANRRAAPLPVALIGYGAIGRGACELAARLHLQELEFVGVLVRDGARPRGAECPPVAGSMEELLDREPEVVVEVAGHDALREHGPAALRSGRDLLFASIGALADRSVAGELWDAARAGGSRAEVVPGGIGGLDALAAAALAGLRSVSHTIHKPAAALLPETEAATLTGPVELYAGVAREGVLRYPESANVAAAVCLAGLGFDGTELRVVADPRLARNHHLVEAAGEFGSLRIEIENRPTTENPRTGRIVPMSVLRRLLNRTAALSVG